MTFSRRGAMALFGSTAALGLPQNSSAAEPTPVRFDHGVASGDPSAEGAILWTRVTPIQPIAHDVPLTWKIAESEGAKPVRSGPAIAGAARDFTVKIDANGLQPGREYWYWFEVEEGTRSPTGRFRTLPTGATPSAVLAVVSCQLYPGGFYNAYDAIARLERLDVVLHLGDYIYEYPQDGYGSDTGKLLGRILEPLHEIVSLADYRTRHAQVKRDAQMQAAHARAAFICVWDDHEVANDDWIGGAENHQPAAEGDWRARKAAAMQAYFEWMPIREPEDGKPWEAINRSFEFGDLATLAMLETRLLARSKQVASKGETIEPDEYAAMRAELAEPDREMMGKGQMDWLERTLTQSVQAGKPWQLIGNQVLMARVPAPDLKRQLGAQGYAAMLAKLPEQLRARIDAMIAARHAGLPMNTDSWDGYPPARERLYQAFRRAGSRPLVLSGDSHAAWANNLHDGSGRLVAAEFGATSITSPSLGKVLSGFGTLIAAGAEEVEFCDQDYKGYLLVTLTPADATADLVGVSTVLEKAYDLFGLARFRCEAGEHEAPIEKL